MSNNTGCVHTFKYKKSIIVNLGKHILGTIFSLIDAGEYGYPNPQRGRNNVTKAMTDYD